MFVKNKIDSISYTRCSSEVLQLKKWAVTICFLVISMLVHAQGAKLVVNGGYINITNGAYLVVDNPNDNAIVRNGSGHIISESQDNNVKWNIGTSTGLYLVPFGRSTTDYIPLSLSLSTAGTGLGSFVFSTYRTANWQNSSNLPTGVSNFLINSTDASAKAVDRFWKINANSYTTKPALTNLVLSYVDGGAGNAELQGGSNTLIESQLAAKRWNTTTSTWDECTPAGDGDTINNNFTAASVPSSDLYEYWALIDVGCPQVTTSADQYITCLNAGATLTGTTNATCATYSWSGPGGFTSTQTNPAVTDTGTYVFTVVATDNGCTRSKSVRVIMDTIRPTANAGANQVLSCFTATAVLDGSNSSAGVNYSWSGPGGYSSTLPTPTVNVAGSYTLTVTNPVNGCSSSKNVTVTAPPSLPPAEAGPNDTITCTKTTASIIGSSTMSPVSYSWAGPGGYASSSATNTVTNTGWYYLTVTNTNTNCINRDSVLIVKNDTLPTITSGGNKTLTCLQPTVVLNASSTTAGVTYNWNGPNGFTSTLQTPTVSVAGIYTLTVINPQNGCSDARSVTVNPVVGIPNISVSAGDTISCSVTTASISGGSTTPGVTYHWSGPNNYSSFLQNITVTTPGTYVFEVINPGNSCRDTALVIVAADTIKPVANAGSSQQLTCSIDTVTLNGSSTTSGVTYVWTGPSGYTSTIATPIATKAGAYQLTVTNPLNGCTKTANVTVSIDTVKPAVSAGGNKTITCSATSVTLNGSSTTAGVSYAWLGPNSYTSSQQTPVVTNAGVYTLTVTKTTNGCKASGTLTVNTDTLKPNANAGPDKTISCGTPTTTLVGNSTTVGVSYNWTGPNSFTSSIKTPLVGAVGNYTLIVTNPVNGCTKQDIAIVGGSIVPISASITPLMATILLNDSIQLQASSTGSNVTYNWIPALDISCKTCADPIISAPITTKYCVTAKDQYGCEDTACIIINVEQKCGEIFVPSAFSPNDDKNNDDLCVYGNCITSMDFEIRDRWGLVIYKTTSPLDCWNGTKNGTEMSSGVYIYTLRAILVDGSAVEKTGNINLIK